MDVGLTHNGSELVVNTQKGKYVAYGPLEPNREKFDVAAPDGKVVKMNAADFLKLLVNNAPDLERTPQKDTFTRSSK